jgi:hypothetical protein
MIATLLFPSFHNFRLWCKATGILFSHQDGQALYLDGRQLGQYRPAPETQGGILAEVTIQPQGGNQHENPTL